MYWVTGVLGFILAIAPFIFGYQGNAVALWTSLVIGIATIVISWIEGVKADREQWEYWTVGVLGIIAIVAPFVLGFNGYNTPMWTNVVLGVLLAIFAGSRLFSATGKL